MSPSNSKSYSYKNMYDDFGKVKAKGYLDSKFEPKHSTGFNNFLRERILFDLLNPMEGEIILDAGCASGRHSLFIAEKGCQVIGIDISEGFIEEAKKHIGGDRGENVSFMVADVENLQFPADYFDRILCGELLEHVLDLDKAVSSLVSVLKPNGLLVISVPNENGKGTLWKRIKGLIHKEKFTPLEDFSMQGIEKHGDAHVRKFDKKTVTEFLRQYPLSVVAIRGCGIVDFPLYDKVLNILLGSKTFARLLLGIELLLAKLNILESLSRHLIISTRKRI